MPKHRNMLSIHQIFIENKPTLEIHDSQTMFLGVNSKIKTNQYLIRNRYKLNSLIIINYAQKSIL